MSAFVPCSARNCEAGGTSGCNYIDRRQRRCGTAWCADHHVRIAGFDYCRRHAGVIRALGEQLPAGLPELNNRAASLAAYLGDELNGRVVNVLGRAVASNSEASLVNHPVRLVKTPGGRERRWQRSWNVVDNTGVVSRVVIEVDEADDTVVLTSVGSSRIGRGTPPWIARREGEETDPERRAAFLEAIGRSIEMVLTRPEMAPTRI
ncbi:MAG: hypothetical protein JOZ75_12875 [Candidatus Dormibacteraeota bacterium]|nr:hypothetical protein [Candidatus Dormibacteraeota bacterium]